MARVLLFGRLADIAGWRERRVDGVVSLADLKARLAILSTQLADALAAPGVQTAVDLAVTRGEASLTDTSEVAFMPPMSGG